MDAFSNKIVSTVTLVSMLWMIFGPAVFATSEFTPFAEKLASRGLIDPQPTATWFRLSDFITRAEMAKIAVKIMGSWKTICTANLYTDVDATLGDLCGYVESAANLAIVSKDATLFRPSDLVTRAEMVKMLMKVGGLEPNYNPVGFSDVPASLGDLYGYVNASTTEGCIRAGPIFRPNDVSTRGEAFKVADCVANRPVSPLVTGGYKPVWLDEFSGTGLDISKWTMETGADGWGNRELQNYTDGKNVTVNSGQLIIEARKEKSGGADYTSARIMTHGKVFGTYGKIEARIKLPYGQGMWPAFWMLGDNIDTVGYPQSGEIDIMEMRGGKSSDDGTDNEKKIEGSLHRPNMDLKPNSVVKSASAPYVNKSGAKFSDDFHIFGIEWEPKVIRYYVDGNIYQSIDISSRTDGFEVFQKPFYIILNLAVGGDFPGSPDGTTVWPQRMVVDWVRVYEK